MGRLDPRAPEIGAYLLVDGARRTLRVQCERTPTCEEMVRIEEAECDQGIGQRHPIAAGPGTDPALCGPTCIGPP